MKNKIIIFSFILLLTPLCNGMENEDILVSDFPELPLDLLENIITNIETKVEASPVSYMSVATPLPHLLETPEHIAAFELEQMKRNVKLMSRTQLKIRQQESQKNHSSHFVCGRCGETAIDKISIEIHLITKHKIPRDLLRSHARDLYSLKKVLNIPSV